MKNPKPIYGLVFAVALLATGLLAVTAGAADQPDPDVEPSLELAPAEETEIQTPAEDTLELLPEPEPMMGCPPQDRFTTFNFASQTQAQCDAFCDSSCAAGGGTVISATWYGPRSLWCLCSCCAS